MSTDRQSASYSVKITPRQLQVLLAVRSLSADERHRGFLNAIRRETGLAPSTIDLALRRLRGNGAVVDSPNGPKIAAKTIKWASSRTHPELKGFSGSLDLKDPELDPSDLAFKELGIHQGKSGTCASSTVVRAPAWGVLRTRFYEVQVCAACRADLLSEKPERPIVRSRWGRRLNKDETRRYINRLAREWDVEPEQVDLETMAPPPIRSSRRRYNPGGGPVEEHRTQRDYNPETACAALNALKGLGSKVKGDDPRCPKIHCRKEHYAVNRKLLDEIVKTYADARSKLDPRYVPRGQGPWNRAAKLVNALREAGVPQACWHDYIRWAFVFAPPRTRLAFVPWSMLSGLWLIENFEARRTDYIRWDGAKVKKLLRSCGFNPRLGLRYAMVARVLLFNESCSNVWSADDLAGAQCLIDNLDHVLGVNVESMIAAQGEE